MQGEVVSVDPAAQTATVKSGKIEGWMEAMTMEYPVKDKAEFSKLKAGKRSRLRFWCRGRIIGLRGFRKRSKNLVFLPWTGGAPS